MDTDMVKTTCWNSNWTYCSRVVGACWAGLTCSEPADLQGFPQTTICRVNRESSRNRGTVQGAVEDWQNTAWSDEAWFLLWHLSGTVINGHKYYECVTLFCLVSMILAAGVVMVWRLFFGPLVPIKYHLKTTVYCTWILLLTVSITIWLQCNHLLMVYARKITCHVKKLLSSQTGFMNIKISLYSNDLHSQ